VCFIFMITKNNEMEYTRNVFNEFQEQYMTNSKYISTICEAFQIYRYIWRVAFEWMKINI
jgi:hypothetical protein